MAKRRRMRWDRVFAVFGPLLLLIILICVCCNRDSTIEAGSSQTENVAVQTATSDESVPVMTELTGDAVPAQAKPNHLTVVIDPGHGGKDGGAQDDDQHPTRFEKDDNLRLGLAVRDAFAQYPDVTVILTRETDEFIELEERCRIANDAQADFFISLHRNSSQSGNGVEIWINNSSNGENLWDKWLADYIKEWLEDVGVSNSRGVKFGFRASESNTEGNNYYVNRFTNMPSCLIEMGFMTSEADNNNFDNRLNAYAEAIAMAVHELATDKGLLLSDAAQ